MQSCNKRISRIASFLVFLLLILSLTACQTSNDLQSEEKGSATLPPNVGETTGTTDQTGSAPVNTDEDRYLDNCAKAWAVCYASCPHFDERNISTIFYAKDNTAYSMMFGKDNVTIISNFLGTDCTYIVSAELDETLCEIFPYFYNEEYGLYIHGIGTQNFEKDWLKDGWDYVTDTYIMMAEMDCETMDIDTVKEYMDIHYKK